MVHRTRNLDDPLLDPVYRNSLREFRIILSVWASCLVWSVGYSWTYGYGEPTEPLSITMGMPSWAFWGVLFPWLLATTFSVLFGLLYMTDDPLDPCEQETPDVPDVEKEALND